VDDFFASGAKVNNDGLVQKVGSGNGTVNVALNNRDDGTVDVEGGTLTLSTGTSSGTFNVVGGATLTFSDAFSPAYTLADGATETGDGTVQVTTFNSAIVSGAVSLQSLSVAGGTVTVNPGVSLTAQDLTLGAGTLTGPGDLTVNGNFTWGNGTLCGTGHTFLEGTSALSGGFFSGLADRTVNNDGTATFTGDGITTGGTTGASGTATPAGPPSFRESPRWAGGWRRPPTTGCSARRPGGLQHVQPPGALPVGDQQAPPPKLLHDPRQGVGVRGGRRRPLDVEIVVLVHARPKPAALDGGPELFQERAVLAPDQADVAGPQGLSRLGARLAGQGRVQVADHLRARGRVEDEVPGLPERADHLAQPAVRLHDPGPGGPRRGRFRRPGDGGPLGLAVGAGLRGVGVLADGLHGAARRVEVGAEDDVLGQHVQGRAQRLGYAPGALVDAPQGHDLVGAGRELGRQRLGQDRGAVQAADLLIHLGRVFLDRHRLVLAGG
jgi:hypothetical protein